MRMGRRKLKESRPKSGGVNEKKVNKVFIKDKEVTTVMLDPNQELTDVDLQDNVFPKRTGSPSKFDSFKKGVN